MSTETDQAGRISELIAVFGEPEATTTRQAREELVALGAAAAPALIEALRSNNTQTRWEATKALGEINAPGVASALVGRLHDDDDGVRWVAADALIAYGKDGLKPVLHELIAHSESPVMREGAHHVFARLAEDRHLGGILKPVIAGLDGQAPEVGCIAPAEEALRALGE
jgi:hypothetical protein